VTNEDFSLFINATGYRTENEIFGWSFVFDKLVSEEILNKITKAVAGAGK